MIYACKQFLELPRSHTRVVFPVKDRKSKIFTIGGSVCGVCGKYTCKKLNEVKGGRNQIKTQLKFEGSPR